MNCIFCEYKTIPERTLLENSRAVAFLGNMPIVTGHTLVAPKRHVKSFSELTLEEKIAIEDLRGKVRGLLQKGLGAQGFNYAWNEEAVAGQSVPHFHLHVLPRVEGDAGVQEYEPRSFLYRPGTRAETPAEELSEVAGIIRSAR